MRKLKMSSESISYHYTHHCLFDFRIQSNHAATAAAAAAAAAVMMHATDTHTAINTQQQTRPVTI